MSKLVVLSLGNGDLNNGFQTVTAQLWEADDPHPMKFTGSLPAAPALPQLYRDWQLLYCALYQRLRLRLEINTSDVTNVSSADFSDLCQRLSNTINAWFNSEPFRNIDQHLRTKLNSSHEIRVIIETNDNLVRRLPWHLWNFFEHYPLAELALSAPEYQRPKKSCTKKTGTKVRILAIFGNSKGIDIEKDKAFLEQLSDKAQTKFLVEPQLEELNDHLWEPEGWDILFFAGHSCSQEQGVLQLNQTDSLTLDQLKYALTKAIARGLKLAIFNSCDGLGLAHALADLHLGQVIVMREPVSDLVAQEFLRHFLRAFSGGQSLYASVREARERLQGLESNFPCASWLPVICQNPAEAPTSWQQLCGVEKHDCAKGIAEQQNRQILPCGRRLKTVLLLSVVVTGLVMGVRHFGMLQTWELQAYDHLMQLRSADLPDQRLLIVTVDEADIQYQNRMGMKMRWSLSDQALAQLLKKLEPYQPRTIGLDIYRDFSVDSNYPDLATRLQHDKRLIAVCKVSAAADSAPDGVSPPPEVPEERLSFSDFVADDGDIARRQLLHLTPPPTSPCAAEFAFSLQIALHYLGSQGIKPHITSSEDLQIDNVVFKPLKAHTSGYQGIDASGYQLLVNYRSLRSPQNIAEQVSLKDVLNDRVNPKLLESLKDRIVLIGITAPTTTDYWKTPYSARTQPSHKQIPGVFVQAQMVSHILSAVLERRPLFWWWPTGVEVLWVWGWSLVGATLAWCIRKPLPLGLAGVTALLTLFGICFGIFTQAGWIPLVPPILALVATQVAVVWCFTPRP